MAVKDFRKEKIKISGLQIQNLLNIIELMQKTKKANINVDIGQVKKR